MIYLPREDSFLLKRAVEKFSREKKFLDIGAGSGIQAITAKKAGALSITAVDINREVIEHLRKAGIRAIKSDLFEKIKERFDLIAFNPPYLPFDEREDGESSLATFGGKKGDEIILRFLKECPKHLNRGGKILLVVSSLTPKTRINALLKRLRFRKKIIGREKFFMESIEVWSIGRI